MTSAKPNLLIVGAAKCGTTTLHTLLSQHPEIFACAPKEPKYFSYSTGHVAFSGPLDSRIALQCVHDRDTYYGLFELGRNHRYRCDASADNLYFNSDVIPAIKRELGDPKIIIALRDPVARLFSAYNHLIAEERETHRITKALDLEADRIKLGYEFLWHYRSASYYHDAVKAYLCNFTNVHVVLLEDFIADFENEKDNLLTFLALDSANLKLKKENSSAVTRSLALKQILESESKLMMAMRLARPQSIKGRLYRSLLEMNATPRGLRNVRVARKLALEYKNDVKKLSALLGRDLATKWLSKYGA